MRVTTNINQFRKTMNNVVEYSIGFLDGIHKGEKLLLEKLGRQVVAALGQYIDINARANSNALHHIYEWYQTGSPDARLFDIDFTVAGSTIHLFSRFKQSRTIAENATGPFFNKAQIMENGTPIVIRPKRTALRFQSGGEEIFTKRPVTVTNPGGPEVRGSYERVFDEFMLRYFKQSFIRASGLYDYIKRPIIFKTNIRQGAKVGRPKGVSTGIEFMANARIAVE